MATRGHKPFTYTAQQAADVWAPLKALKSLGGLKLHLTRKSILDEVTFAVRWALSRDAIRQDKRPPSVASSRRQLTRLAKESGAVLEAWNCLSFEVKGVLTNQIDSLYPPSPLLAGLGMTRIGISLEMFLGPIAEAAQLVAASMSAEHRGRPRENILTDLGFALAVIWFRATEEEPTWTYDAVRERVTSPFREFAQAAHCSDRLASPEGECVSATG